MPVGLYVQSAGTPAETQTAVSAPGDTQVRVVVTNLLSPQDFGSGVSVLQFPPPPEAHGLPEDRDAERRQLDKERSRAWSSRSNQW